MKEERDREKTFAEGYAKLFSIRDILVVAVSICVNLDKKWLSHFILYFRNNQ